MRQHHLDHARASDRPVIGRGERGICGTAVSGTSSHPAGEAAKPLHEFGYDQAHQASSVGNRGQL
jgi:hypothetical protein